MIQTLVAACGTIVVCLIIQCFIVSVLFEALLYLERKRTISTTLVGVSFLLTFIMMTLLAGNLLQMALWAGLFLALGEFPTFDAAFYHSVVNFTTLGYGDVVMSGEKRLFGALEAANGVLMIGLTSAFLFSILYELMERKWDTRIAKTSESN